MLARKEILKRSKSIALRGKNQVTLPKDLVPLGVERFECTGDEEGRIILTPLAEVPVSQRYFWTKRWQEGEREADEDARAGRVKQYDDVEDLIAEIRKKRSKKRF